MGFTLTNMTKQEIAPLVGKFIEIECNYYVNKKSKVTQYLIASGHIIRLEDKYLLFKDNENYKYLVPLEKVWNITFQGKRRTVKQYQKMQEEIREHLKKAKKENKDRLDFAKRIIGRIE